MWQKHYHTIVNFTGTWLVPYILRSRLTLSRVMLSIPEIIPWHLLQNFWHLVFIRSSKWLVKLCGAHVTQRPIDQSQWSKLGHTQVRDSAGIWVTTPLGIHMPQDLSGSTNSYHTRPSASCCRIWYHLRNFSYDKQKYIMRSTPCLRSWGAWTRCDKFHTYILS